MRKWLGLLMFMLAFVSGCWGRTEVDQIGIVVGLGVDYITGDQPILLTAQVVNPGAMGKTQKPPTGSTGPFIVITSQGRTLFDAIRNFSRQYPRRLVFSHNKVVVMGKRFAERDLPEVLDFIERDREFRENIWMLVAEKSAKEVMQLELALESLPAIGLNIIMKEQLKNAFSIPIEFYQFSNQLKDEIGVSVTPLIKIENFEEIFNEQLKKLGDPIKESQYSIPEEMNIDRTAIFKDRKLIGSIGKNETRGLLWLKNKLKGGTVIISEEKENELSAFLEEGKVTFTPIVKDMQITMKIECKGEARINEVDVPHLNLLDKQVVQHLEEQIEKILTSRVKSVIEIAQKDLNADFIGFGQEIKNQKPKEWKKLKGDWEEIFPDVQSEINFDIKIKAVGLTTNPE